MNYIPFILASFFTGFAIAGTTEEGLILGIGLLIFGAISYCLIAAAIQTQDR